jgi:hypothetical protein
MCCHHHCCCHYCRPPIVYQPVWVYYPTVTYVPAPYVRPTNIFDKLGMSPKGATNGR